MHASSTDLCSRPHVAAFIAELHSLAAETEHDDGADDFESVEQIRVLEELKSVGAQVALARREPLQGSPASRAGGGVGARDAACARIARVRRDQ